VVTAERQTSGYRLQTSAHRLQTSGLEPQATGFRYGNGNSDGDAAERLKP
jgi:hypothetical protein